MLLRQGYLTVTIMKTTFNKLKPRITNYRKYKNFSNDIFRDTFLEELSQVQINNDDEFNNLEFTKKVHLGKVIMHHL